VCRACHEDQAGREPSRFTGAIDLARLGHDVDTVVEEGLRGQDDPAVWAAAGQAGRFLITQDLDFSDIRHYLPGSHPGILLICLHHPAPKALASRVRVLFETEDVESWSRCFVVATASKIRIRSP
jgi:predicted nuclease of predicted toxin-antitoxin system